MFAATATQVWSPGLKFIKVTAKIIYGVDQLPIFLDYRVRHWIHLRTAKPIWVYLRYRGYHQRPRLPRGGLAAASN